MLEKFGVKVLHQLSSPAVSFVGSAVLALIAAGSVYKVIDLPMIELGKRIADRVERQKRVAPAAVVELASARPP